MQKLKNILYDKNDIFVALVIVCIASFIIFNRIEVIMGYPSDNSINSNSKVTNVDNVDRDTDSLQEEEADQTLNTSKDTSTDSGESTDDNTKAKDNDSDQSKDANADKDSKVKNYSVYIESGANGSDIANILISVNLIKDKQEFYDAMSAAGAESKLQAGTFIIPSNSTPAQIVSIITK